MAWRFVCAVVVGALLLVGCSGDGDSGKRAAGAVPVVEYDSFPRVILVPQPTAKDREIFAEGLKGTSVTVTKDDGKTFSGHVTSNSEFLKAVLVPALLPHREKLAKMNPVDRINALTLFGHEAFRVWFGKDAYAWGGHIRDLDDPQEKGPNFDRRFGLDCSGFAALPYELALELKLMSQDDPAAVLTSAGFEKFAREYGVKDLGGREGTSNRWRVDTIDMTQMGTVIFTVPKNGAPRDEQVKLMQAGDVVLAPGHAGLTVMINGAPYYLEHGGWVCPPNGSLPYAMREAMVIFAKQGELTVRRVLP